jgi:hypothetical protein
VRGLRERSWPVAAWTAVGVVAVVLRSHGLHRGLIYPDGYQYLLMAKGIATHLTPTLQLGHGGALFVPTTDAAMKPLFPALVALFSVLVGLRGAAELVTVLAGSATIVLSGLLATRLSRSRAGGAIAAVASLFSPLLAYWAGFTGPDTLAQALALGAALALAYDRVSLVGVLGALCVSARPEFVIPLLGGALAALLSARTRERSLRALLSGAFTLAAILALLHPPLAVPTGGLPLLLAAIAGAALLLILARQAGTQREHGQGRAMAVALAAAGISLLVVIALSARVSGLNDVLRGDWPLLLIAACGLMLACARGSTDNANAALTTLVCVLLLGATYAYRNAGSERYFALLLPAACVLSGFVVLLPAAKPAARAARVLAPAGLLMLALLVVPGPPRLANDSLSALAGALGRAPAGTLVSAAPDAYGFLLPGRAQQPLEPGARGLILLDAAQRAYAPQLGAQGTVVARLRAPHGFERPDGTIDLRPAILVRGVVVRTG